MVSLNHQAPRSGICEFSFLIATLHHKQQLFIIHPKKFCNRIEVRKAMDFRWFEPSTSGAVNFVQVTQRQNYIEKFFRKNGKTFVRALFMETLKMHLKFKNKIFEIFLIFRILKKFRKIQAYQILKNLFFSCIEADLRNIILF